MTPDIHQARNSALEIFEQLTIAQSPFVKFAKQREYHLNEARIELARLAYFLGERVVSGTAAERMMEERV